MNSTIAEDRDREQQAAATIRVRPGDRPRRARPRRLRPSPPCSSTSRAAASPGLRHEHVARPGGHEVGDVETRPRAAAGSGSPPRAACRRSAPPQPGCAPTPPARAPPARTRGLILRARCWRSDSLGLRAGARRARAASRRPGQKRSLAAVLGLAPSGQTRTASIELTPRPVRALRCRPPVDLRRPAPRARLPDTPTMM